MQGTLHFHWPQLRRVRTRLPSWRTVTLLLFTAASATILLWEIDESGIPLLGREWLEQLGWPWIDSSRLIEWAVERGQVDAILRVFDLIDWAVLLVALAGTIAGVAALSRRGIAAVVRATALVVGLVGTYFGIFATFVSAAFLGDLTMLIGGYVSIVGLLGAVVVLLQPVVGGMLLILTALVGVSYALASYGGQLAAPLLVSAGLIALFGCSPAKPRGREHATRRSWAWVSVDFAWLLGARLWIDIARAWYVPKYSDALTALGYQAPTLGFELHIAWLVIVLTAASLAPFALWAILFVRLLPSKMSPAMALLTGRFALLRDLLWRMSDRRSRGGLVVLTSMFATFGVLAGIGTAFYR